MVMNTKAAASGGQGPRRRRTMLLGGGLLAVCAVALAVVLLSGGGDNPGPSRFVAASCKPGAARTSGCPYEKYFKPTAYIGRGAYASCYEFASQADAQEVLRADPRDPNRIDLDGDGIACQDLGAPYDWVPVKRLKVVSK
jgi:hypothetical protein